MSDKLREELDVETTESAHGSESTSHEPSALDRLTKRGAAASVGGRMMQRKLQRRAARHESLDPEMRQKAEQSLGTSLGEVRVHQGPEAHQANAQFGSKAFAVGGDVVLGPDVENSANPILAHEVAHVAQQKGAPAGIAPKLERDQSGSAHERDADYAASRIMAGLPARVSQLGAPQVQCYDGPAHDPKAAASGLRPELQGRVDLAHKVYARLAKQSEQLEHDLGTADAGKKAELQAKKAEVDSKIKVVEGKLKECDADLKALNDPSTPPEAFNKILARQKSDANTRMFVDFDYETSDLKKKSGEKRETKTTTQYQNNAATTSVDEKKTQVGPLGASHTESSSHETLKADSRDASSGSRATSVNTSGLHDERHAKDEQTKDGKTESRERTQKTDIGPGGASRSQTDVATHADGSSQTSSSSTSLERKDGSLAGTHTSSKADKNAAGDTDTSATHGQRRYQEERRRLPRRRRRRGKIDGEKDRGRLQGRGGRGPRRQCQLQYRAGR